MSVDTKINILVVDDESSIRGVVSQVLKGDGHTVSTAENAENAFALLAENPIQMVITDIRMNGMDGIELLEKIKSVKPDTEVVIMTSYGSLETSVKAIRHGAFDYVLKPFEELSIISTIGKRVAEKIHLKKQQQQSLESLKTVSEEVLNRLNVGVISVDETGKALTSNQQAKMLLANDTGLRLENNTLTASTVKIKNELIALIKQVSHKPIDSPERMAVMKIPRREPLTPLTFLVSAVNQVHQSTEHESEQATAMILITEENQKIALSNEVLNLLYGLTPAEARLTIALAEGLELDQIAKKQNVSQHTIRGHLKNVFKKTGAHRQSELISMVLTGPANLST